MGRFTRIRKSFTMFRDSKLNTLRTSRNVGSDKGIGMKRMTNLCQRIRNHDRTLETAEITTKLKKTNLITNIINMTIDNLVTKLRYLHFASLKMLTSKPVFKITKFRNYSKSLRALVPDDQILCTRYLCILHLRLIFR